MNIKLFFEISKEFFELIHPSFVDDIIESNIIPDIFDEEKAFEELSDDDDEPECGCNLCHIMRQIVSFINPTMYKKLNPIKID